MSDLSDPPFAAVDAILPADADPFLWPTPRLAAYPAPAHPEEPPACTLEGLNGRTIHGALDFFDPQRGLLQVRQPGQRKPLPLKLNQFRRLRLAEPLRALPQAGGVPAFAAARPVQPFTVHLRGLPAWRADTVGHVEEPYGLFLFEPVDDTGTVVRWFVPRQAYDSAEIGLRIGEALVEQDSASPEQIRAALAEQEQLRQRKLGDMLVVRQLISPEELAQAIERQARMPMVRIGEALVALGFIGEAQLGQALAEQRADRSVPLGELLVKSGRVTRADLQTALARKMGYPLVDVLQFPADAEAVNRLPHAVATRVPALPLMMRAGRLVVAVEDPSNRSAIDQIEFAAQCKVVPVLARAGVLPGAIDAAYEKLGAADVSMLRGGAVVGDTAAGVEFEPAEMSRLLASMERGDSADDDGDDDGAPEQSDNTLVRLINSMILEAHQQGVSDIHIECPPGREKVRIRFRRDGALQPYLELPHNYRAALIGRLKIMCDLDISERRKPQDGKINFARFVPGLKLELRVATIPTANNLEDAVLRLLANSRPIPLEQLGLAEHNLRRLEQAISRPWGLVLCVGPTGSGKTTTLHSVLSRINTPDRKIWTAEDPVEITQPGLRQVQVNPRIEWTFAKALRAFLRADPDVIMVGEVRDGETAQVAIEAGLTGHLVLSTLHTNSAPETVTRLLDMGMDPFNFADALLAVLAQRLVRRLCPQCRTARDLSADEEQALLADWMAPLEGVPGAPEPADVLGGWRERFGIRAQPGEAPRLQHWHAPGCRHCSGTGWRGRVALHELMSMDRGLRQLVQGGKRADELQQHALAHGMRTLRQDGIEKVLAGASSIEEVRANS